MMKTLQNAILSAGIAAAFLLCSFHASQAGTLQIQLGGVNLSYNGSAIHDAGSNAGGVLDPADADPLTNATFLDENNIVIGVVNSNVSLDLFIPDVTGISSAPNTDYDVTTPGTTPGYFDLLIGTSPLASEYLALELTEVNVRYFDLSGLFQFTFGAAVADIGSQNLPFGLIIGDPVTVSFSAQVTSKTTGGGFITSFLAAGTGEIRGTLIPEPTSAMLIMLGLLATPVFIRRRA